MVVFSVQAELPSRQYVRLVGNLEKLGKWSPYESLELQPFPRDCRYVITNWNWWCACVILSYYSVRLSVTSVYTIYMKLHVHLSEDLYFLSTCFHPPNWHDVILFHLKSSVILCFLCVHIDLYFSLLNLYSLTKNEEERKGLLMMLHGIKLHCVILVDGNKCWPIEANYIVLLFRGLGVRHAHN